MGLVFRNLVREVANNQPTAAQDYDLTGTGDRSHRSFAAAFADAEETYIFAFEQDANGNLGGAWEIVRVTFTAGTPDTLSGRTLLASSTGALIDWSAVGATPVLATNLPAEWVENLPDATTAKATTKLQGVLSAGTHEAHTFALLGGLEIGAVVTADANQMGTAGELFRWDISGLTTANKTFTLPGSADIQVGERVGLYIDTGDDAFEVEVRTNALGDTIRGVDRSAASGPWVLFITGEMLVFECLENGGAGAVKWTVVHDERIPQFARATGSWTHDSSGAFLDVQIDTIVDDIGDIVDLANNRFIGRREAIYVGVVESSFTSDQTGEDRLILDLEFDGSFVARTTWQHEVTGTVGGTVAGAGLAAAGVVIDADFFQEESSSEAVASRLTVYEQLVKA